MVNLKFVYTAPTANIRGMISLDSEYKARQLQYLMILMQHHLDFKSFLNVLIEIQRFLQDIQIKHVSIILLQRLHH